MISEIQYPLVTIVIPAHDAASFIRWTLDSVCDQTLADFECLVVNDASDDKTLETVKHYRRSDKRVKLINFRANSGAAAARNCGLRMARGKYVCFLDADDLLMMDSLELRVATLDNEWNGRQLIGTYCGSMAIDEACHLAPRSTNARSLRGITDHLSISGVCPFNSNQPLFITEKLKRTSGFDEQLAQQGEDYEYWIRILRLGYYLIPTPFNLVTYRNRSRSTIKEDPDEHLGNSLRWHHSVYVKSSDKSAYTYRKPIYDYRLQADVARRVFEFVAMDYVQHRNVRKAAQSITESLPDYSLGINRHVKYKVPILNGMMRQLGMTSLAKKDKSDYQALLDELDHTLAPLTTAPYAGINILPSFGPRDNPEIVFLPHKDYHVWTIDLIAKDLDDYGITYAIVDLTCHYKDEGVRVKAAELGLPLIGYNNWVLSGHGTKILVAFNDWDPIVRSIMVAAQSSGIATAAIVEGIQDYLDVDTCQQRFAYRTVDTVFLPGAHDTKYFGNSRQETVLLGVPRIHQLAREQNVRPTHLGRPRALVNSNFSYGVLERARDGWLSSAVDCCLRAGYEPVISRHPADKGSLYPEFVTDLDFYSATRDCDVHISRFASGILEALAMEVPCIYYNPHEEKVDKFTDPKGSYPICTRASSLIEELNNLSLTRQDYLYHSSAFVDHHCGRSDSNASLIFASWVARKLNSTISAAFTLFQRNLTTIDNLSGGFSNTKVLRECLPATYAAMDERHQIKGSLASKLSSEITLKDINRLIREGCHADALRAYEKLAANCQDGELYAQWLKFYQELLKAKGLYGKSLVSER